MRNRLVAATTLAIVLFYRMHAAKQLYLGENHAHVCGGNFQNVIQWIFHLCTWVLYYKDINDIKTKWKQRIRTMHTFVNYQRQLQYNTLKKTTFYRFRFWAAFMSNFSWGENRRLFIEAEILYTHVRLAFHICDDVLMINEPEISPSIEISDGTQSVVL